MVDKKTDHTKPDPLTDTAGAEHTHASHRPVIENGTTTRQNDGEATSYSNYLFGRAGAADKPLWSDSTKGRIAIRLVSRGLVAAVAMTFVDRTARRQLQNYMPADIGSLSAWWKVNTSQKIAKVYDVAFGKPIYKFVHAIAPAGKKAEYAADAVHFRYKAYFHDTPGLEAGHSLGAEAVQITAPFAAGSLGDAATRNVLQMMDPNSMKSWMVNEKGEAAKPGEKKHFDFGKWASATAKTSWRVVSKNMGEDWAVALPYVYQMRWQRNVLGGNRFPNVTLDLHNSSNGGSTLIDKRGKVVGDYQLPGAMDLHFRFIGYNWYTLMYRETYDAVGRQLSKWKENGFSLHPHLPQHPITGTIDTLGYGARYIAKSFIKSNLYMWPAMPFFWAIRTPQSKWRASPIVAGQDPLHSGFAMKEEFHMGPYVQQDVVGRTTVGTNVARLGYRQTAQEGSMFIDGVGRVEAGLMQGKGVYSWDMAKQLIKANPARGLFSAALMPLGWASYHAGSVVHGLTEKLPSTNFISRAISSNGEMAPRLARELFSRNFVDSAFSYTPYMIAKAETALRVDERPADGGLGAMDKAIYKFIDSTVRFRMHDSKLALKDIWKNARDMGREVQMREGGEVSPNRSYMAPEDRPMNQVHAGSVEHAPTALQPEHDASDKSWAESVTGQSLSGRFQPGPSAIN